MFIIDLYSKKNNTNFNKKKIYFCLFHLLFDFNYLNSCTQQKWPRLINQLSALLIELAEMKFENEKLKLSVLLKTFAKTVKELNCTSKPSAVSYDNYTTTGDYLYSTTQVSRLIEIILY